MLTLAVAMPVSAQSWPSKPVTFVSGYAAGSGFDVFARFLADNLRERLGQPCLVEARPGAYGNIAAQYVAHAAPDGYTVLLTANSTHAANIHLYKNLGFDPIKDFTPVTTMLSQGFVLLVNPAVMPVTSVGELTDYIKARPGKLDYGASAVTARIATELYLSLAGGLKVTYVPYKAATQAFNDLLAGQIHFMFTGAGSGVPQARAGKLRALAVTNAQRTAAAPEIPTMAESGLPGYEMRSWFAIFLPAGTPMAIAKKLAEFSNAVWASEKGREFLRNLASDPFPGDPGSLARLVENEIPKWGRIIRGAHIQPQ